MHCTKDKFGFCSIESEQGKIELEKHDRERRAGVKQVETPVITPPLHYATPGDI